MARYYKSLMKEWEKAKPNNLAINAYLNKEFRARRNWVRSIKSQGAARSQEFFQTYPCFKDHVEVHV